MCNLHALAHADEHHRVIPNEIAAADSGEANGIVFAFAGNAFAAVEGALFEVAACRLRDDFAHAQRGARRRIDLQAVMRFDDFDVVAFIERFRRSFQQLEGDVDTDAEVGRHCNSDVFRRIGDGFFTGVVKARGADDRLHAEFAAHRHVMQRAFGAREIDDGVAGFQRAFNVVGDFYAAGRADQFTGVFAQMRTTGNFKRGG